MRLTNRGYAVAAILLVLVAVSGTLAFASGYPQLMQIFTVKNFDDGHGNFSSYSQVGVDNNAHATFCWGRTNDANYGYCIQYSDAGHGWQLIESGYGGWAPIMLTDETSPLGAGQLVLQNGFFMNANQRDRHYTTADALPTDPCFEGDVKFNLAPTHVPVLGWMCVHSGDWHAFGALLP